MEDCTFCRIVSGELPSSQVYADNLCVAFMDIQPVNAGHLLVVPRVHATLLQELEEATCGHLLSVAARLGAAVRRTDLRCEALCFHVADGAAAGQEIAHAHLHCFPRFRGDGFGLRLPAGYPNRPSREDLDHVAQKIRKALEQASGTAGVRA